MWAQGSSPPRKPCWRRQCPGLPHLGLPLGHKLAGPGLRGIRGAGGGGSTGGCRWGQPTRPSPKQPRPRTPAPGLSDDLPAQGSEWHLSGSPALTAPPGQLGAWGEFPSRPQPCYGGPHLGRGGATHDAGQHLDHVDSNGVGVLVQHLGGGGAVRRGGSRAAHLAAGTAVRGVQGQEQVPRAPRGAPSLWHGSPVWHQALHSSPELLCLIRTPGPSLSSLARATLTKRPGKAPRLGRALSPHPSVWGAYGPPPAHPPPPTPDTRVQAGQQVPSTQDD